MNIAKSSKGDRLRNRTYQKRGSRKLGRGDIQIGKWREGKERHRPPSRWVGKVQPGEETNKGKLTKPSESGLFGYRTGRINKIFKRRGGRGGLIDEDILKFRKEGR